LELLREEAEFIKKLQEVTDRSDLRYSWAQCSIYHEKKCPICGQSKPRPRYSKPDGTPIPAWRIACLGIYLIDKLARATCPHCGQSWFVFKPRETS